PMLRIETRGLGSVDQEIVVEADRPIRQVSYDVHNIDTETRIRVEKTADPRLFDFRETEAVTPNHFRATVTFTDRDGIFTYKLYHPNQIVICVEFTDGTRVCRVFDLPPGRDLPTIVVNLR